MNNINKINKKRRSGSISIVQAIVPTSPIPDTMKESVIIFCGDSCPMQRGDQLYVESKRPKQKKVHEGKGGLK